MKDRIPTYPGRVTLVPVEGQPYTYDMTMADAPTEEGTALSKGTLLSDATAAAIQAAVEMLASPDTPSEALAAVASVIGTNGVRIATGSYVGTGTFGVDNPCSITFDFAPKIVMITAAEPFSYSSFFPGATDRQFITDVASLTTSYVQYVGFGYKAPSSTSASPYGKKSEDGKTVFWYSHGPSDDPGSASYQLNSANTVYYYFAIG